MTPSDSSPDHGNLNLIDFRIANMLGHARRFVHVSKTNGGGTHGGIYLYRR